MRVTISNEAIEYIKSKGGQLIIFQGCLTGCCAGNLPSPMMELGSPRRPLENYEIITVSRISFFVDKDLDTYKGTGKINLDRNFWWKSLSFCYHED